MRLMLMVEKEGNHGLLIDVWAIDDDFQASIPGQECMSVILGEVDVMNVSMRGTRWKWSTSTHGPQH